MTKTIVKISIASPNTQTPTVTPTTGRFSGSVGDITLKVEATFSGGTAQATKSLTLRTPHYMACTTSLPAVLVVNSAGGYASADVAYQAKDQLCSAFPSGLMAGVMANESFPTPPRTSCYGNTGSFALGATGTVVDSIGGPTGTCLILSYSYVQTIDADAAFVENSVEVTVGGSNDTVSVAQNPTCP